ncbi:hypothetical protein PVAP13_2KG220892 [Panicum virgatum]|uniref:Uncharacterized protein n=1 Tax=Panicum virgatum TaxID=38727 RepID=A0A8T0W7V3_PANVG|nr:hypothetical protein PVAP13_2KG220892 [Panicum virgatum]
MPLPQSRKMERNEEEKPRRIVGVAVAAGAVAVAAGAFFFMLSRIGDDGAEVQDQTAGRTMKGPGTGGERISRAKFKADTKKFFKTSRSKGPKAAVDAFK